MERFQRAGLTFDVRDGGPAGGDPVVLLHGFPQDGSSWRLVEPLLHAAGLRTLAPDQRGYSPGARPPRRADYRIIELVDDVLALLDAAGLSSAHVVGHDWGGAVAWQLAGRYPERVRSLTVLSTPHPQALAAAMRGGSQFRKSRYILFFQLPVIPEFVVGRLLESSVRRTGLPAEFAAHNAERMRQLGALTATLNWYRAIPLGGGSRGWPGFRSAAGPAPAHLACAVPTTYLWGSQDAYLGRAAAEATADFVTAPYRFVELDASHWLPETRPAEVAALIADRVRSR